MSDVIDRPILAEEEAAKSRLAHHRLRRASEHPRACRYRAVHAKTLAAASSHLRQPSAHALYRHHAVSALLAADRAPRCVAADRRAARLRSRFHAKAASRSARRRVRHSAGARPLHLLAAKSRIRRSDPARHQRLAARVLVRPRSAAEGLDPRRPGRYAARDRRDRALREDRPLCADQCLPARQRAARTPPLLADLCARAGARPAARHSCRRLWRPRADRRRLAVLLCRGAPDRTRTPWRRSSPASFSKASPSAFRS